MAHPKTLTSRQLEILRWIDAGCPDGVMEGDFHKISAAALRNRGLVKTSGHGEAWKAKITKQGREYISKADGPDPPIPRQEYPTRPKRELLVVPIPTDLRGAHNAIRATTDAAGARRATTVFQASDPPAYTLQS